MNTGRGRGWPPLNSPRITLKLGLYNKYTIIDNRTGEVVTEECFVLKPKTDEAARIALKTYADAIDYEKPYGEFWTDFKGNPKLASDIRKMIDHIEKED